MKRTIVRTMMTLVVGSVAFAHGEDRRGPHGGYIRMPGTFHTEIVPEGNKRLRVYLLDIEWMNPVIKSSSVRLKIKNLEKSAVANCDTDKQSFLCTFENDADLKSGYLIVESNRNGEFGKQVSYALPLSIKASEKRHSPNHGLTSKE